LASALTFVVRSCLLAADPGYANRATVLLIRDSRASEAVYYLHYKFSLRRLADYLPSSAASGTAAQHGGLATPGG